jgi:hypothetical protein
VDTARLLVRNLEMAPPLTPEGIQKGPKPPSEQVHRLVVEVEVDQQVGRSFGPKDAVDVLAVNVVDGFPKAEMFLKCSPAPDIGRLVPPFLAVFIPFPFAFGPSNELVAVAMPNEVLPEVALGDIERRLADRPGLGELEEVEGLLDGIIGSMLSNLRACSTITVAVGFSPLATSRKDRFQAALVLKLLGTFSQPGKTSLRISVGRSTIIPCMFEVFQGRLLARGGPFSIVVFSPIFSKRTFVLSKLRQSPLPRRPCSRVAG